MSIDISTLSRLAKQSARSASRADQALPDQAQSAEDRQAERLARREARIQARRAKQNQPEGTSTADGSQTQSSNGNSITTTTTPSSAQSGDSESSTQSSTSKSNRLNFRGDLRGANLVHFAVQGTFRDASGLAIFAHGQGPHAIDPGNTKTPPDTSSSSASTSTENSQVNGTLKTVA